MKRDENSDCTYKFRLMPTCNIFVIATAGMLMFFCVHVGLYIEIKNQENLSMTPNTVMKASNWREKDHHPRKQKCVVGRNIKKYSAQKQSSSLVSCLFPVGLMLDQLAQDTNVCTGQSATCQCFQVFQLSHGCVWISAPLTLLLQTKFFIMLGFLSQGLVEICLCLNLFAYCLCWPWAGYLLIQFRLLVSTWINYKKHGVYSDFVRNGKEVFLWGAQVEGKQFSFFCLLSVSHNGFVKGKIGMV